MLVEVNTWVENAVVVAMAEEALASDSNIHRDYWMGGIKTDNIWSWQSGESMEFTNWWGGDPDGAGQHLLRNGQHIYTQLLKRGFTKPGKLQTFYWARSPINDVDNGVICEKSAG